MSKLNDKIQKAKTNSLPYFLIMIYDSTQLFNSSYLFFSYEIFLNYLVDGHNLRNNGEVLSDVQQLDSIDEAGLDATLVIPPTNSLEDDEFVFL